MKSEKDLEQIFNKIPTDVDIILTHTPPKVESPEWKIDVSELDTSIHCGSSALTKAIDGRLNSVDLFCGHIHSGDHDTNAYYLSHDIKIMNVSYLDENYRPHYPPNIFSSVIL